MENQQGTVRGAVEVAGTEAATVAKKERERDRRLRKTYGITLDDYNQILAVQDGKCAICGRLATEFNQNLNVDHLHFSVVCNRVFNSDLIRVNLRWQAKVPELNLGPWYAKTKRAVIATAKKIAMPFAVRGLLCPGRHGKAGHGCCNRLLGRVDERWWLQAADRYLGDLPARKVLDNPVKTKVL